MKPDYATAQANLAAALLAIGNVAEARSHVELCRKFGGTPPQALIERLSGKK